MQVKIMLPTRTDPKDQDGISYILPDKVKIKDPKEYKDDEQDQFDILKQQKPAPSQQNRPAP